MEIDASSLSLQLLRVLPDDMSGQAKGMKRARTQDQQDGAESEVTQPGRDQLLLSSPDLQTRLGRKFVDETELLPLMLAHGLVRRVRTIQIHVRPLGGDSFKVALEAASLPWEKQRRRLLVRRAQL
jgi:hypothetical protein